MIHESTPISQSPNLPEAIAYHVGRAGEVSGGMSQVINSYLSYPFVEFVPRLVLSRDGSTGIQAAVLWLRSIVQVAGIPKAAEALVVVHLSQRGSFVREGALLLLAAARGLPTVAQVHGSSFPAFSARAGWLVRPVLERADLVLALSDETMDAVTALCPSADVRLLPNAVAGAEPSTKERLVLFGGAVSYRKGVDVLLEAWRSCAKPASWKLVLAGPVEAKGLVDDLPQSTEHLGPLEHDRLMTLLSRASVAVLPSRDEGMPMFILEAMARRAAVISTSVGGIPKVLDGRNGMVVPPDDVPALRRALESLMFDADRCDLIAATGHRTFSTAFSEEVVFPRVEMLWKEAVSKKAGFLERAAAAKARTESQLRSAQVRAHSDHADPGPEVGRPERKLVLAASTGGHLAQLVRLAPGLRASPDSLWITFANEQSKSLLKGKRVLYVPYIKPRDWRTTLAAVRLIARRLKEEEFEGAVSTGAALAVAALPVARMLGMPSLYIESVSRIAGPSLTGKLLAASHLVNLRTQHPSWARGRWAVHPSVFNSFQACPTDRNTDRPRLFVSLGTIRGYRFDALIDAIMRTGLADDRTVWQVGETLRSDLPGRVHQEMSAEEFMNAVAKSDVVITHAGVGTFMHLMEASVYPVLVPRRAARNEHVDDHQQQIAALAAELDLAIACEVTELSSELLLAATRKQVVEQSA